MCAAVGSESQAVSANYSEREGVDASSCWCKMSVVVGVECQQDRVKSVNCSCGLQQQQQLVLCDTTVCSVPATVGIEWRQWVYSAYSRVRVQHLWA